MQELSLCTKELSIESSSIAKYLEDSLSFNTRRTYANGVKKFLEWGGTLPCSPDMIARYLNEFAGKHKFSTLTHRLKAIGQWHQLNRQVDPTNGRQIKLLMKGIRNTHHYETKQAPALSVDNLRKIYKVLNEEGWDYQRNDMRTKRNIAMLMIGYFGFLRQSEIINIQVKDLQWVKEGLILIIPHSKTDQKGEGQRVAIQYGDKSFCPIVCIKEWLECSGIKEGHIFRKMPNCYAIAEEAITDPDSVSNIVKAAAKRANLDNAHLFSGHSLRCGPATDAFKKGAPSIDIQKQGRWVSPASMQTYIRRANLFDNNVTGFLLS